MKCISCEGEINPQWAHAIDMNVCPFCGKHIMEEHLKNLLGTLRETMEQMSGYQAQLDDWMLSNHNYIKTDSPDITKYMPKDMIKEIKKAQDEKDFQERKKFTVKVKTDTGVEEVQAEKIQDEEKTNEFFKRAEVIKPLNPENHGASVTTANAFQSPAEKTSYLKKIAQQIKKAGAQGLGEDGNSISIPAAMMAEADPEAVAEFQSLIAGDEIVSSLPDTSDGDEVPSHILQANMALAKAKGGANANAADLLKLQQMQDRLKNSKDAFESGANRGKGGFSRSG